MILPDTVTLPDAVTSVCEAHADLVDQVAPGLLDGLYLHGSICFDGEFFASSDVDFVATLTRRPGEADVEALRRVHADLGNAGERPAYDGFYLLERDLAGPPEAVPPTPGVLGGWFSVGRQCDQSLVTWHELAERGITLRGKAVGDIPIHQDAAGLRATTRANLDGYWSMQLEALRHHPREAALPGAAEWGGLGAPRLHHLLATGRLTSKSGGGRWALEAFPQHREVVEEALRVREQPDGHSTYANDPARRGRDLIALMTDVIDDALGL
ncbi:MAG: DUF4111 domain-containing protein [Humibacillus sp.]|nr:DUF4111 domain-containing protein [Humibacillus sp.]MDN5778388.1 DUF4111 domain-containing protein [Humibacillus sp.]